MGLAKEALLAAGLLFDDSGVALADPIGGDELLAICESSDDRGQAFCDGYVVGSLESMKWGAYVVLERSFGDNYSVSRLNFFANHLLGFCVPAQTTNTDVLDVVHRFLLEHPGSRSGFARGLIERALIEAYPCP